MGWSWGRDRTIVPFSGWFNRVEGAVAWSVTAVGLPLSMVLQFPGDSPSVLALVSMGIQQMSPIGEATQCLRLGLRFCSSSQVCPPRFYLAPPPLSTKGGGLLKNDLAIVPSNFSLELQCYWSSRYGLWGPVLFTAVSLRQAVGHCNSFTLLLDFSQFTNRTGTRYIDQWCSEWQVWGL